MLAPPKLQCRLYGYQQNSLAKMLQREMTPVQHANVYYVEKKSPWTWGGFSDVYYFDPDTYNFYRAPSIPLYADTKGGILCDEMGVGKTTICLALILATVNHMPLPEQTSMASAVTSDMARDFPAQEYQGVDPSHTNEQRIVKAAFGAPSPGERMSRKPKKSAHVPSKATVPKQGRVPGSVSLVQIAAHRLRTTHACRADLREMLPVQLQPMLGPSSAPYFLQWPPAPSHVSRQSQGRAPVRVYVSSATLILVPQALLVHWTEEIEKHCEKDALRILVVSTMREVLPRASILAQEYDVVLMTHARFGKEANDEQSVRASGNESALMQVYWKRVIIDEGDVLAGDSLMAWLCTRLRVERRWIVTSTMQSIIGTSKRDAAPMPGAQLAWLPSERKNLDRLKQLFVRFLCIRPLCTVHPDDEQMLKALSSKERDWHALMASAPAYPHEEWAAKRRLYDLFSRVMIRNRTEDVQQERPLPPLERHIVMLTFSEMERLTYNVLLSLIMANAALTQENNKDYLFHPTNKKALTGMMEHLSSACFHLARPNLLEQAWCTKELLAKQLDNADGFAQNFQACAKIACEQLQEALSNDAWCTHMKHGQLMYQLEGVRPDVCRAWSASSDICLTSEELFAFRKAVQATSVKSQNAHGLDKELLVKGEQWVHQKARQRRGRHDTNKARFTAHRNACQESQPPLSSSHAAHVSQIQLQGVSSTKLQHMVLEILGAVDHEKILIFSSMDSVLYELSHVLELLHIPSLMYIPSIPQHLRNEYASEFARKDLYRCLLISTAAGSRGLDLHCASRVISAEPIWQRNLETQVVKHAWRVGQTHRVQFSTYVIRDTLEQYLVERKKEGLLDKDGTFDSARLLTDDPDMRDFVAHPRLVKSSTRTEGTKWAAKICTTDAQTRRPTKRIRPASSQGK